MKMRHSLSPAAEAYGEGLLPTKFSSGKYGVDV
jgi:hypothetical protein